MIHIYYFKFTEIEEGKLTASIAGQIKKRQIAKSNLNENLAQLAVEKGIIKSAEEYQPWRASKTRLDALRELEKMSEPEDLKWPEF